MSEYPLIVATLLEFNLITDAQADAAMGEWYEITEDYDRRRDEFRERWLAERAEKPWWRRMGDSEYGWASEWFKEQ